MKRIILFIFTLLCPLLVHGVPEAWQVPGSFPTAPDGTPTAAYPLPKLDWERRVWDTNARAQANAGNIGIIFDGDSITDGWQAPEPSKIWKERYEKLNAFNFGISGDRTQHLLWRLSQGQVDNMKPKLIVILIGTNNLGNGDNVEDTISGIKAVVLEYQKRCPEAVILLQALFPRSQSPSDPVRAKIKGVNDSVSKLADGQKVIYIDFGSKFLNTDESINPELMPDFLHPSPKGYQIWADAIQPVIDQYFKK